MSVRRGARRARRGSAPRRPEAGRGPPRRAVVGARRRQAPRRRPRPRRSRGRRGRDVRRRPRRARPPRRALDAGHAGAAPRERQREVAGAAVQVEDADVAGPVVAGSSTVATSSRLAAGFTCVKASAGDLERQLGLEPGRAGRGRRRRRASRRPRGRRRAPRRGRPAAARWRRRRPVRAPAQRGDEHDPVRRAARASRASGARRPSAAQARAVVEMRGEHRRRRSAHSSISTSVCERARWKPRRRPSATSVMRAR